MTSEKMGKLLETLYHKAILSNEKGNLGGAIAYYDAYFELLCAFESKNTHWDDMLLTMQEEIFNRKPPATRRPA